MTAWPITAATAALLAALLTGCMTPTAGQRGPKGEDMSADQFAQTDFNRTVTLEVRDNLASLYSLLDKLYRRNPREWRKTGVPDLATAVNRVKHSIEVRVPPSDLAGLRDIQILAVALDPNYSGDRVGAFIYGLADTIIAAHNGKTRLYATDALDGQRVYNAARNVEAAAWLLATRRNNQGELLLLANEISPNATNLSFEREFGKMIGNLDLISTVVADKTNRTVVRVMQNIATAVFLPVGVR